MQIPFWMVTGTYLITHEWIEDGRLELIIFSIGSAAGAFIALVFIRQICQIPATKV
jgi:hypothetical protein